MANVAFEVEKQGHNFSSARREYNRTNENKQIKRYVRL